MRWRIPARTSRRVDVEQINGLVRRISKTYPAVIAVLAYYTGGYAFKPLLPALQIGKRTSLGRNP